MAGGSGSGSLEKTPPGQHPALIAGGQKESGTTRAARVGAPWEGDIGFLLFGRSQLPMSGVMSNGRRRA